MSNLAKQRRTPLNYPNDGNAFSMMLEAMSIDELTDALNDALENITEENYDPALIDAYLDALDRKDPMPEVPDAKISYANFQKRLLNIVPEYRNQAAVPIRKFRKIWRVGLVAVLAIICMLGGLVVAQAAGLDVFGAVARWTDEIFSFGEITSDGAKDVITSSSGNATEFASLQEALDLYSITEVSEPLWIPEGYTLNSIEILCMLDGTLWYLSAEYTNGTIPLHIAIESYQDEPDTLIEKTDTLVETFAVNDTTVYLLQNINNNVAAWVTEHYECFIDGAVTKSELQQMVFSIYANS